LRERREGNRSLKYALIFLTGFAAFFHRMVAGKGRAPIPWPITPAVAWEEHLTDKVHRRTSEIVRPLTTNDARIYRSSPSGARLAAALPPAERRYQFRATSLTGL